MATGTLTNQIKDPTGAVVTGVVITARLRPGPAFRGDFTEIAGQVATVTDGAGSWSLALEQNSNIIPAGSWWEIEEDIADSQGGRKVWAASVGGGTQTLEASLVAAVPGVTFPAAITLPIGDARYAFPYASVDRARYVSAGGDDTLDGRSAGHALATIGAAVTALGSGGLILVGPGTFPIAASVTVPANTTIRGSGWAQTTITVTSLLAGGTQRAALESSGGGVTFEDLGFSVSTANAAIGILAGTSTMVRRCSFTGTGAGNAAIEIGTWAASIDTVVVEACRFVDVTNTYAIEIRSSSSRTIRNVTVRGNHFERCHWAGVKFTALAGVVYDTEIAGNAFVDIIGDAVGTGQYGTAVQGGSDAAYQIDGVDIHDNTVRLGRAGERCGAFFVYCSTRIKVNHNTAVCTTSGVDAAFTDGVINSTTTFTSATATFSAADAGHYLISPNVPAGTTIAAYVNPTTVTLSAAATATAGSQKFLVLNRGGTTDSTFLAPGRVGFPDVGIEVLGNQVQGFGSFWDPDSMVAAEVAHNLVVNCSPQGMSMIGYGTQDYANVHDNTIIDSIVAQTPAAIVIGNITSAKACQVHSNTIVDDRTPPVMLYGIETTGGGAFDSSDVRVHDNHIQLPNADLVQWLLKQNGANVVPVTQDRNMVASVSGRQYQQTVPTGAITVTASPFTWTNPQAYPVVVNVFGGTVSNVSSTDLQVANTTPAAVLVQPGRVVSITYTVAPTMRWEKAV